MSFHRLILWLHLWAGAIAAVFLIVLGVTGSLMVFEDDIDHALNPKLTWVHPTGSRMTVTAMQAAMEKRYPGYKVASFDIPPRQDVAWRASLAPETRGKNLAIAFNPYTGEILGNDADRNNFAGKLHQLHLRLLLDRLGQNIVGWAGPFLLLLSLTGLVLWWPRKIISFNRKSSGKKINFDLHQAIGIWASVFLMMFALTAIVIRWEKGASEVVNALTNSPEPPPFPRPQPPQPGLVPLNPDRLLAIAESAAAGARPTFIQLAGNPIRIALRYPEDRTPAGRTNILIEPHTGNIVFHLDARTGPLGFRYVKLWNREIHTGDIFGWPTRMLAAAVSLLLPVLAVTGPLIWWNRRRKKASIPIAIRSV
jgi:uncharacterized iron-regulated membrane protein